MKTSAALVAQMVAMTVVALGPASALADDDDENGDEESEVDIETQPHLNFTGGVGLLALPAAEVCPFATAECEPGESALAFSLFILGRIDAWSFGASGSYALGLRPTEAQGAEQPDLLREHSRSYFLVEGHFRRYLPPLGSWNWWVGASGGVVIINDSWTTLADREPYADTDFVGPKAVTLATEGLSLGVAVGGHIRFWEVVVFGTHLRYANWLLPPERESTPVGDLASLAGRIDVIDVGVTVGFLLPI